MLNLLFASTAVLYATSAVLYLVLLVRGGEERGAWATRALVAAIFSHVAFLGADWASFGHPPVGDIHDALSITSLVISAGQMLVVRRGRLRVLGAFTSPLTLLFFLGAVLGRRIDKVSPEVKSALLPIHVGANLIGIAVFTMAFAVAIAYVIQERLLKRKQLGGLFHRLPPLDVLDTLNFHLVIVGFVLLTIGVISGTIWAVKLSPDSPVFTAGQTLGFASWSLFAAVLGLRAAVGWRGRRAAIGTMLGFACAVAVLIAYVVRAGQGSVQ